MRRFLISSLLSVVVLIASIIVVACREDEKAEARVADKQMGEIIYLEGDVGLNDGLASIGDEVMHGDIIVTPAGGLVEIQFGERRVLRTEENTELVIDNVNRVFDLQKGSMAVVQSRTGLLNKHWVVQTPTVAAAVRGTVYYTKVEDPYNTYFCLCNGKITLEGGSEKLDLDAAHHDNAARFIKTADGSTVSEEVPMIYHIDEDMESLAAKVGVEIDWTKIP